MERILIAEDEPDIRELISLALQFNGFEVISASDGAEAVELASNNSFDLIMLDVRMPRLTGYEACRQLREMEATKEIPIIFLSAKGQEAEVDEGLEAGADRYILKPFAPIELANEIKQILAERGT
ncbi:MAG TPA: two-component system response regulator [Chloroflexi bacterium]|nr:two-component system response regulator [Chloroflexota bacterium]